MARLEVSGDFIEYQDFHGDLAFDEDSQRFSVLDALIQWATLEQGKYLYSAPGDPDTRE